MKTHTLAGVALTALILAGFAAGGTTRAGARDAEAVAKEARKVAAKAGRELARGDAADAVVLAERALALAPQDLGYRRLLANAYLKAGRFTSARQVFSDVLAIDGSDGKAALYVALSQIAEGQWDAARQTLSIHAAIIPARDRGLAIALAGDPASAVAILTEAARAPDADARTRQNLALALGLAGHWREARSLVGVDLAPAEANKRILQWLAFARPQSASDQVAHLLGVVAVRDAGRPEALALAAPVPVAPPVATAEALAEPAPVPASLAAAEPADDVPAPLLAAAEPAPAPIAAPPAMVAEAAGPRIVFGPRQEVVQPLPVAVAAAPAPSAGTIRAHGAFKTRIATAAAAAPDAPAKGGWYVQLGAFENAAVARDHWQRALRRFAALDGHAPAGMTFRGYYRLSVGGFARTDALAMCRNYRASGGRCFVRMGAGDQMAAWLQPGATRLAARAGTTRLR